MALMLNLHNHTPFSDGAYTIDEICEAHLDMLGDQIAGVGISDYLFCTPSSLEMSSEREFERVFGGEAREYVRIVTEARKRWQDRLPIYCGCEINMPLNRRFLNQIRQILTGVDYVLFEQVDWAGLTTLANQSKRWPCRIGLADTRIEERFPNTSMDQVVRTMANARIFHELNHQMMPLSPNDRWFNMLPRHRVLIALGSDTHDDLNCIQSMPELYQYASERGLRERLFEPRPAHAQALAAS